MNLSETEDTNGKAINSNLKKNKNEKKNKKRKITS